MPYERKTIDLFISDDLRKILEQIKSDSIVAELLLKQRHSKEDIVDSPVNYISISSNDKSRISYLTTERISKMTSDDYWSSSKRFHTKPGAFVGKIFNNISQQEIEKFSNLYRSQSILNDFKFKVVTGEEIRSSYHYSRHDESGSLGSSCMKHESCQKLLNLYVENTDKISLLLMLDSDGYIMGRSLLWNFGDYKIMDRIYTTNDEQLPFYFKKWATENGYYYKSQQNWYNSCFFEKLGGDKKFLKLDIKLNESDFDYYPYMDTFKFFSPKTKTLSNYKPNGGDFYTLCSSDGSKYEYNYLTFDDIDMYFRNSGDCVYLSYSNINTNPDRCVYSGVNDCYILRSHARYCQECEDYIFIDEFDKNNIKDSIERRKIRLGRNKVEKEQIRLFDFTAFNLNMNDESAELEPETEL